MTHSVKDMVASAQLLADVSDSWKLDAELLLAAAMNCSRTALLARPEQFLTPAQQDVFDQWVRRRLQGEPVAYILGRKGFWDFELLVDKRVLVPRPETELLVEQALDRLQGREDAALSLADLGTGSGAIAIALARHSPNWQVTAIDCSGDALLVARENLENLHVPNIRLVESSWFENVTPQEFDLIVSNPPYVAPSDPHLLADGLEFEPEQALVATDEGLSAIREIVQGAQCYLKKDAWLLLEHGFQQARQVAEVLRQNGYSEISCWQDLAGLDRVTAARFN